MVQESIGTDDGVGVAKDGLLVGTDDGDKLVDGGRKMREEASLLSSARHQAVPCSRHFWLCSDLQTPSWESLTWRGVTGGRRWTWGRRTSVWTWHWSGSENIKQLRKLMKSDHRRLNLSVRTPHFVLHPGLQLLLHHHLHLPLLLEGVH